MPTDEFLQWKASEAHSYLSRARGAQARIQTLAATIADIYEEIIGIKAVDYSGERVSGGLPSEILEQMLDDKQQRQAECQAQAHEAECLLRRIAYCLGKMDDQLYAAILEDHYINGNEWYVVAEHMNYSLRNIHNIRFMALLEYYDCMVDNDIPSAI